VLLNIEQMDSICDNLKGNDINVMNIIKEYLYSCQCGEYNGKSPVGEAQTSPRLRQNNCDKCDVILCDSCITKCSLCKTYHCNDCLYFCRGCYEYNCMNCSNTFYCIYCSDDMHQHSYQ